MTSALSSISRLNALSILFGSSQANSSRLGQRASLPGLSAANPASSSGPAQQVASGAEHLILRSTLKHGEALPPAQTDDPRAPDHVSNVHSEITINGRTYARAFNDGSVQVAPTIEILLQHTGVGATGALGPDGAEDRIQRIAEYLAGFSDEEETSAALGSPENPLVDIVKAETAQTQEDYIKAKLERGEAGPGFLFSGTV